MRLVTVTDNMVVTGGGVAGKVVGDDDAEAEVCEFHVAPPFKRDMVEIIVGDGGAVEQFVANAGRRPWDAVLPRTTDIAAM